LSYHWVHPDYGMLLRDGDISILKTSVEPGTEIRVVAGLWAPYEPGRYQLQWDLRSEGGSWFSERGIDPLCVDVTVEEKDRLLARPRQVATLPEWAPIGLHERHAPEHINVNPGRFRLPQTIARRATGLLFEKARSQTGSPAAFGRRLTASSSPPSQSTSGSLDVVTGQQPEANTAALEQEVRFLEHRVRQREEALVRLNRRLHSLEQPEAIDRLDLSRHLAEVEAELVALRSTKTFRYTIALRRWYAKWMLERK
jgi:hypothetical protein